jgi:hypothetical protein
MTQFCETYITEGVTRLSRHVLVLSMGLLFMIFSLARTRFD